MNTRKLEIWILIADMACIALAFLGADALRYGLTWTPDERVAIRALLPFVFSTAVVWTALSVFMPMDGFRGGWKLSTVFSHVFFGASCTVAVLVVMGYFTRSYVSRLAFGYFLVLLVAGFLGVRFGVRQLLRARHAGGDIWRVMIIGSGRVAQEVAAKIEQHPEILCRVVGLLFPNQEGEDLIVPGLAYKEAMQMCTLDIFDLLRKSRVNEVIVALSQPPTAEIRTLLMRISDMGIETSLVPQSYELYAAKPNLVTLDGLPLVQLREPGLRRRYVVLKRALDVSIAAMLLPPAFAFLSPIAGVLLLKKHSALRREIRCGQYGTTFRMLRLNVDRPVRNNSKFEQLLEYLSITELPQLWNVVRGEMSLVGPRPDPPDRISLYSDWQQRRLRVRPGMTGLAQVHGLRDSSSPEQKTRFDLQYAVNPYLLADISLLLQTVWTLFVRLVAPLTKRQASRFPWQSSFAVPQDVMPDAHSAQPSAD
jgi:lipopolysaccharide/colanic/teichoic acid biosynthesis glycosyltransferase